MTRDEQVAEILRNNFKPKNILSFINGEYAGYLDITELKELESEARRAALKTRESDKYDALAYVYAYYDYSAEGALQSAHFYSGYPKTGAEYDKLAEIPNVEIRAIFSR